MKHSKGSNEVEINPQLLESIKRDLGVDQDQIEEPQIPWTPPVRPMIPFHSLLVEPKATDPTEELFGMYQKTKHLIR